MLIFLFQLPFFAKRIFVWDNIILKQNSITSVLNQDTDTRKVWGLLNRIDIEKPVSSIFERRRRFWWTNSHPESGWRDSNFPIKEIFNCIYSYKFAVLNDGYADGLNKIKEVFHVTRTPNRPTVSHITVRLSILMYTLYTHVLPGVTWKNNRPPNCRDALVHLLVTLDQTVSSSCLYTPNCYFYVMTITFISSAVVSNI